MVSMTSRGFVLLVAILWGWINLLESLGETMLISRKCTLSVANPVVKWKDKPKNNAIVVRVLMSTLR